MLRYLLKYELRFFFSAVFAELVFGVMLRLASFTHDLSSWCEHVAAGTDLGEAVLCPFPDDSVPCGVEVEHEILGVASGEFLVILFCEDS